jgi:Mrp family chromosome partitioning ATPase
VGDTAAIASYVDALVFVVNPDKVRRHALGQARSQLSHLPCRKLGIIEVAEREGRGYYGYYSHHDDGASSRRERP